MVYKRHDESKKIFKAFHASLGRFSPGILGYYIYNLNKGREIFAIFLYLEPKKKPISRK